MSHRILFRYRALLVEDDPVKRPLYENGLKKACAQQLQLALETTGFAQPALSFLRTHVCPFLWLDQRLPMESGGPVSDDNGVKVGLAAVATQPLKRVFVLTVHPDWRRAALFSAHEADYAEKGEGLTPRDYGERFVKSILAFEQEGIWMAGSRQLPMPLGEPCLEILNTLKNDPSRALHAALNLWDTGLRLLFLSLLGTLQHLGSDVGQAVAGIEDRLNNGPMLTSLPTILDRALSLTASALNGVAMRELRRFFADPQFLLSMAEIHKLRNIVAHSPPKVTQDFFDGNRPAFVCMMLGLSFWARHPVCSDMKLVRWGGSYALQGRPIAGRNAFFQPQTWSWDGHLAVNADQVYQVLTDPETPETAFVVPLHPLIIRVPSDEDGQVWFAHYPRRNEYRNPLTGETRVFENSGLAELWSSGIKGGSIPVSPGNAERVNKATGAGPRIVIARKKRVPQKSKDDSSLAQRIRREIMEYYLPEKSTSVDETDRAYQDSFAGDSKARDVLHCVDQCGALSRRLAYVSVGGGDGSEIIWSMRNSSIQYGILLEYSDYGAERARQSRDVLAKEGKTLLVLQGDATQRLNDCAAKLAEWKANAEVEGVVLSLQAILHELPFRSPRYDPNILLARVFEPFQLRIFHSREPTRPSDWPPTVHLRIGTMPGSVLSAVSRLIKDALGFACVPQNLADGYVQMDADLAAETLFKVLYSDDVERYRYEMQEKLTAFDPEIFCRILKNYIRPPENVDSQFVNTDTFKSLYRRYSVDVRSPSGDRLSMPKLFVRITGCQADQVP